MTDSNIHAKQVATLTESKPKKKPYQRPNEECFDFKVLGDETYSPLAQRCYQQWADLDADCIKKWHKECEKSYTDIGASYWKCRKNKACPEPDEVEKLLDKSKKLFKWSDPFGYYSSRDNSDCLEFTDHTHCFDRFGNFDNDDDECNKKFREVCQPRLREIDPSTIERFDDSSKELNLLGQLQPEAVLNDEQSPVPEHRFDWSTACVGAGVGFFAGYALMKLLKRSKDDEFSRA